MGGKCFDNPKNVNLVLRCTNDNKNAIVLDFFSGLGTTADAVGQQNATDGGNRRFILVQLPEKPAERLSMSSNDKKLKVIKNGNQFMHKLGLGIRISVKSARKDSVVPARKTKEESPDHTRP